MRDRERYLSGDWQRARIIHGGDMKGRNMDPTNTIVGADDYFVDDDVFVQ
jgi:hypothetical protein